MQRSSARSVKFTELESMRQIPLLQENSHICDVTTSLGKQAIMGRQNVQKDPTFIHMI